MRASSISGMAVNEVQTPVESRRVSQGARSLQERRRAFLAKTVARGRLASKSWPSFINYVEGCFRSAAETIEPGRCHNFPNARLAGLGTQAQSDFLRS